MMATMRSISLGEMGRVRDCSLSKFITWLVNSLQAWTEERERERERERREFSYAIKAKLKFVSCVKVVSGLHEDIRYIIAYRTLTGTLTPPGDSFSIIKLLFKKFVSL